MRIGNKELVIFLAVVLIVLAINTIYKQLKQ